MTDVDEVDAVPTLENPPPGTPAVVESGSAGEKKNVEGGASKKRKLSVDDDDEAPSKEQKMDETDGIFSDRSLVRYDMGNKTRGQAIIINQQEFHKRTKLKNRKGSEVDVQNLEEILTAWGLNVSVYKNQSQKEIGDIFEKARRTNHKDADCFLGIILTHGTEGNLIYGTDNMFKISDITDKFKGDKCDSLAGKPKLFFIQACRGEQCDSGVEEADSSPYGLVPVEADFLYVYATAPGYFSFRNDAKGSWLVQSMMTAFKKHGKKCDLLSFMTEVNGHVTDSISNCPNSPARHLKQQTLWIVSTLRKAVYF